MPITQPVFDKFFNKEDAEFYSDLFKANNLHPQNEDPYQFFDAITGHDQKGEQYILRLPIEEFDAAQQLINEEVKKAGIPEDYYLLTYTDAELADVLVHTQQWSRQDIAVASLLLQKRGIAVSKEEIARKRKKAQQQEKEKRKISTPILVLLYLVAPFGAIFLVTTGLIIYSLKDYTLDGQKDYVYNDTYRDHGIILAIMGLVSTIGWWLLLFH